MEWLTNPEIWIGLITLTALAIVLGIDNVIFISILAGKLPERKQSKARRVGLSMALLTRIALLLSLTWVIGLTTPIIIILGIDISGRDLVLVGGGLFLIAKSTLEIHNKLEASDGHANKRVSPSFASVIVQILLLDIIFSLRLGDHRCWHGGTNRSNDCCCMYSHDTYAYLGRGYQLLRHQPPDNQNSGSQFSLADWHVIDHGRIAPTYTQRLYLFCNGFFNIY